MTNQPTTLVLMKVKSDSLSGGSGNSLSGRSAHIIQCILDVVATLGPGPWGKPLPNKSLY